MVRARKELPDANEVVVATVKEVFDYGAYVELDEYKGMRAYLPWSEVATKWVKDINEVLKVGQKIVVKVIRVNKQKNYIDVSLKRVYDSEKKKKMQWYKRNQRAEKILEIVAQRLNKTLDDAYKEAGWPLEDYYGDIYSGLENAVLSGPESLKIAGVKEEWIQPLYEEALKHIRVKKIKISGTATVRSFEPNGIEIVRSILLSFKEHDAADSSVNVYTIGAPRYKIEVISSDYKEAERLLLKLVEKAEKIAQKNKAIFEFSRDKA